MKYLWSATLLLSGSGFGFMQIRSVSPELLKTDLSFLEVPAKQAPKINWRAVGVLQISSEYNSGKKERELYSGFFFTPNLFLTYRDPDAEWDCNAPVKSEDPNAVRAQEITVSTRFTHLPESWGGQIRPEYKCHEIVRTDPKFRYAVLRMKIIDENEQAQRFTLPLLQAGDDFFVSGNTQFSVIGYSSEGRLFYSDHCLVENHLVPSKAFPYLERLGLARWGWAKGRCLFRNGMKGAPILVRIKNHWVAVGLVGMAGEGGDPYGDFFSTVIFPKIERFSQELEGLS